MVKGVFANHIRQRPFDLYVAVVIFLAGLYAIVSPTWPEIYHEKAVRSMIWVVSFYLMAAATIVIISLLCNRSKRPVFAILAEMWGWLAISAASFAVSLMFISMVVNKGTQQLGVAITLGIIWVGLSLASGFRSLDIYLAIRGHR